MTKRISLQSRIRIIAMRFGMRFFIPFLWLKTRHQDIQTTNSFVETDNHKIPIRLYTPTSETPLPIIIYFHGGGFVIGGLNAYDGMCSDLSKKSNSIVISIDYRLAPEHPFPHAPNDCITATQWIIDNSKKINGDTEHITVAGDSAGGNLAAITAIQFPKEIKGQILIYPVLDHYHPGTDSYIENAKGQGLTRKLMMWFWDCYLINCDETRHPLATPILHEEKSHLPSALIITAEKDPLRDEAIQYAKALTNAGVSTQHTIYKGLKHGFIGTMGPNKHHDQGMKEICNWLLKL